MPFNEGDWVICIDNTRRGSGIVFTDSLTIGKYYQVVRSSGFHLGPEQYCIWVRGDSGPMIGPLADRFVLAKDQSSSTDYSKICSKIKQMNDRRKEMGYKF